MVSGANRHGAADVAHLLRLDLTLATEKQVSFAKEPKGPNAKERTKFID